MIPIGELDRSITIQKLNQGTGATYGEPTEAWTDFATVWAKVREMKGTELADARQISAQVDTRFFIRYIPGLNPLMRISYNGAIYDIEHMAEMGRREYWDIMAKARRS